MSIPNRIWRLLRTEVNSRLGRLEPGKRHPFFQETFWQEVKDNYDGKDPVLAQHYKTLELPYGAPLENVRASYKRLMKKYHPDRYRDAGRKETATELVKRINEAYRALKKHLEESPAQEV